MNQASENILIKPSDLPSPPQTALQILRICSQEDVNTKKVADLVKNDPILSAELLRVVNSSFFGISKEISSIKQAIVILGNKSLHNLALCISTRDVIKQDDLPGFAIDLYWEDSLRRASCAKMIGRHLKIDADECFTAGLLQDFGLLVMFFLNKDKSHLWLDFRLKTPDERYRLEIDNFYITHDVMIENLASTWGLPESLTYSLGNHHKLVQDDKVSSNPLLPAILNCADWLSSVYSIEDTRTAISTCREKTKELLGLDVEQLESLLVAVPEETEKAAAALGLRINEQVDYEQLMLDANLKLVEENIDYQELNWQLEKTIKERDDIAQELHAELELAREIQRSLLPINATTDYPLTGINISAKCLSGDFYDYFPIEDGRIFFNLGDVSGKGVNAALLMTKISSLFRCLGKRIHDLPELMSLINAEIVETSIRGMFVTMIAGIFNPKNGLIEMVNAGHPPAFLIESNEVKTFEAQSPPLGIVPNCPFKKIEFQLANGCLYLYSDGVIEGLTENGEELGLKGLLTQLLALRKKPVKKRFEQIIKSISNTSYVFSDDVTLLGIENSKK